MQPPYKPNKAPQTIGLNSLDDFFSYTQPIGSIAQAAGNTLRGINQTRGSSYVPVNRDSQGYVFFTRPMLNLSDFNLIRTRDMRHLLSGKSASVQRYVRCMLDPSLKDFGNPSIECPLVDNNNVFMPLLTNTILSLSGWPDVIAPTYTSKQGARKEQWSIIDGTTEINQSFDLDATFLNLADEPVTMLFSTWLKYASYVFDGTMIPYAGFETRNEIDYTTRIYRVVMDRDNRFVKKIACTVASFPLNDPAGKFFDFDRTKQYTNQTREINIRFKCMGALYNDDAIPMWFNKASGYANPGLAEVVASDYKTTTHYEKIPRELLPRLKYQGYPLINTNTYELEWWIDKSSAAYKKVINNVPDYIDPMAATLKKITDMAHGISPATPGSEFAVGDTTSNNQQSTQTPNPFKF